MDLISGNSYVWEKEGFGGEFIIKINKDRTFEYYEGFLSSYIGFGVWTIKNDTLILTEKSEHRKTFYFQIKHGELIYVAEGSSNFMHVTVEDRDKFILEDE